jgi:hypothetical protein
LINSENNNLQKEIEQLKQETSSKLDIVSKLEAQLETKNLETSTYLSIIDNFKLKFINKFHNMIVMLLLVNRKLMI